MAKKKHKVKLFSCGVSACDIKELVKEATPNVFSGKIWAKILLDPGFSLTAFGQILGAGASPPAQLSSIGNDEYQSNKVFFSGISGGTVTVSVTAHVQADLTCSKTKTLP